MGYRALFSVLIGVALSVGCKSGTKHSDAYNKCNDFLHDYCNKALDCFVSAGLVQAADRNTQFNDCLSSGAQSLPCGRAVSVTAGYSQCIDDLNASTCDPFVAAVQTGASPLPASCQGVVLISG